MPSTAPPAHRPQSYNGIAWGRRSNGSLPIAETTIATAAKYLEKAAELITERYGKEVSVVYGDTDSVFLKTVESVSVPDAIKLVCWRCA
jgi:DNA polymerase elongation subunit (family B)